MNTRQGGQTDQKILSFLAVRAGPDKPNGETMGATDHIPTELFSLGLDVSRFRRVGRSEFHGPCPRCGGDDRFVVFTDREYPHWNWWCRQCHPQNGWIDELNPALRGEVDENYRLEAERRRSLQEEQDKIKRKHILEKYTTTELWQELHRRMTDENYRWWSEQGVPREWVDFWQFGYEREKTFNLNGSMFTCPAYTLPKFEFGRRFVNLDYRLIGAPPTAGKYRMIKHLPAAAFISDPTKVDLCEDEIFVVEGSKKAAVVSIRARAKKFLQVIGIPSCNSWAGWDERLRDKCGRVWVIFDPDAGDWAHKFARSVGSNARIVTMPVKPDDAFVQYKMNGTMFDGILKGAVVPTET